MTTLFLRVTMLLLALFVRAGRGERAERSGRRRHLYTTTLRNGLNVVVVEDRVAPVVQTSVWYGFGSLDETPGKTGLAHALEHMIFRGTPEISAGGLDDITARLGAQMNGETSYDYTQFYFEMPADKLDVALFIEADRMQHAALRAADWAIERRRSSTRSTATMLPILQLAGARARRGISRASRPDGPRWEASGRRSRDRRGYRTILSRMVRAEQRDARRRRRRKSRDRVRQGAALFCERVPRRNCRRSRTSIRFRRRGRPSKRSFLSRLRSSISPIRSPATRSAASRRSARSRR